MVRVGGVSYTIDVGKPIGSRISDLTLLRTGKPLEPAQGLRRRRLGQRERRHARPADLGRGDGPYREEEGVLRPKDGRSRARCGRLKKFCQTHANSCIIEETTTNGRPSMADTERTRPRAALSCAAALAAGGAAALGGTAIARAAVAAIRPTSRRTCRTGRARSATASRCAPTASRRSSKRNVIRRDVEWLTASRESSVSFTPLHALDGIITPNGLCFERHHSGIAEIDPADYRLILHGLVDKPLIFTLDDIKRMPRVNRALFLRMRGQFRHGMARRAAQWLPIHARHGALRDVYRRAAQDAAR